MHFQNLVFWPWLQRLDENFFRLINSSWSNPVLDAILPHLRNSVYWLPLYLFLIVFVGINFRKQALWWTVFFLVTVAIADYSGTRLFKYGFERIRPCNAPEMQDQLRLLVRCPSGYGFISNHAANHFAMATFIFLTLHKHIGRWAWAAYLWAGAIAYAQIYVGVHYPLDIIAGSLWGLMAGTLTGTVFVKQFGLHR